MLSDYLYHKMVRHFYKLLRYFYNGVVMVFTWKGVLCFCCVNVLR